MEIPDFLPLLSKGAHTHPRFGVCLMEYASILGGERFSDHPACIHPVLQAIGVNVNDWCPDGERNRLALLLPRLVGTGQLYAPHNLPELLWRYVGQPAAVSRWFDVPGREHATSAVMYGRNGSYFPAMQVGAIAAAEQGAGYMYLEQCLDVFDRVTGRKERPKPFTEEQYRELAAKVGAAA